MVITLKQSVQTQGVMIVHIIHKIMSEFSKGSILNSCQGWYVYFCLSFFLGYYFK